MFSDTITTGTFSNNSSTSLTEESLGDMIKLLEEYKFKSLEDYIGKGNVLIIINKTGVKRSWLVKDIKELSSFNKNDYNFYIAKDLLVEDYVVKPVEMKYVLDKLSENK